MKIVTSAHLMGAQKITNLGKLPSEQKRKTPKRQKKNKNYEGKLPSQKENSGSNKL